MANPFEITAATNTVALDNKREGVAAFTVRNVTRRRVRAVGKLQMLPADSPAISWITIVPSESTGTPATTDVRDFAIDASQQYQVRVAAPPQAAPGSYAFKLVVADEINPDENFTASPDVTFTVVPPPVEEKKPLPGWLIPLVVVVILVVVGAIFLVINERNRQAQAAAEATQTLEAARLTADAGTAQAIVHATETAIAEQGASAAATATQAAALSATQTAFNRYTGNWAPTVENPSAIRSMRITNAGNNRYDISYSSNCPPAGNVCLSQPQTFTISGIAYDPLRLVAAIQNTVITLEPASDGRLLSRMIVGTTETTQLLQPSRRVFDPDITIFVTMVPDVSGFLTERQFDTNFLRVTVGP
jgi:hypothetical protein